MSAIGIPAEKDRGVSPDAYNMVGLVPGIVVVGVLALLSIGLCIWRRRVAIRGHLRQRRADDIVGRPSPAPPAPVFTVQLQKAEAARKAAAARTTSPSSVASIKRNKRPVQLDLERGLERNASTSSADSGTSIREDKSSAVAATMKEIIVFATVVPSPTPSRTSHRSRVLATSTTPAGTPPSSPRPPLPVMLPSVPRIAVRQATAPPEPTVSSLSRPPPPPRITLRKATAPTEPAAPRIVIRKATAPTTALPPRPISTPPLSPPAVIVGTAL